MGENKARINSTSYMIQIYLRILLMIAAFHVAYMALFAYIGLTMLAWFNVGSVTLYLWLTFLARKNRLREVNVCVHIEVVSFTILSVILLGWEFGFQYLLICIASTVYFCPYKHKIVPYIYSILEAGTFAFLYVYTRNTSPISIVQLPVTFVQTVCLFNIFCSFGMIMYVAFTSNLSQILNNLELKNENKNLVNLAERDPLTNLLNRRGMTRILEQRFEEFQEDKLPFAIVIGDIDDFKVVNDNFGHDCGDHVLKSLSSVLEGSVRGRDAVCRWGGEEFLILLNGVDCNSTYEIVERLRHNIETTKISYESLVLQVQLTFGAYIQCGDDTLDHMIKKADEALYQGKKSGKNCTVVIDIKAVG